MRILLTILSLSSLLALTSCADVISGSHQIISVTTTPENASCELQNKKGTWYIHPTPGSVTVHQAYSNLKISCKKRGYQTAFKSVKSHTRGEAALDVLAVSPTGGGVDMATGAAYIYPQNIHLDMLKRRSNAAK
jgi:hypothetical protein